MNCFFLPFSSSCLLSCLFIYFGTAGPALFSVDCSDFFQDMATMIPYFLEVPS